MKGLEVIDEIANTETTTVDSMGNGGRSRKPDSYKKYNG